LLDFIIMVSFTSLVVLSLMAASQVAQSAVVPETKAVSLPLCNENPDFSVNSIPTSNFDKDEKAKPTRLVGEQSKDLPTIVQIEKSEKSGKMITTIDSPSIYDFTRRIVSISWTTTTGGIATRYFVIQEGDKCRVKDSAQYADLLGAGFNYPGRH